VDNLEEIIKGCQKGQSSSQKALYELYAPKMFGVCLQYCKDETEAEDCLQEGFIKVFKNIKKYRFEGSFEGWVRRIMVNATIESFRKKKPVSSLEDITMVPVADDDITEEDAEQVKLEEVYKIMKELPPKYRMIFNLYAIEGLSHKEIAELLDISVGTSKSNLARARKWIRDKIMEKIKRKQNAVC